MNALAIVAGATPPVFFVTDASMMKLAGDFAGAVPFAVTWPVFLLTEMPKPWNATAVTVCGLKRGVKRIVDVVVGLEVKGKARCVAHRRCDLEPIAQIEAGLADAGRTAHDVDVGRENRIECYGCDWHRVAERNAALTISDLSSAMNGE